MMKFVSGYIEVYQDILVSCESVWNLITDTTRWVEWGPSIKAVECKDRYIRNGTKGKVQTAIGVWLNYEITAYDKGKYWAWSVLSIPATGHRIEPQGYGICRLIFEIPFLALPYACVCNIALKRINCILEKCNE